jgi:hypothetical protein
MLIPPTGVPAGGLEMMISKTIKMAVPSKLRNDANGLCYSDLCGDVVTTFIPSVSSSDYVQQINPSG